MIRIDQVDIEEFRGIRKLSLSLGGKNFAVCGPNGTGKSGIVDALEFALTGNVSRLSGEGTGQVTLKQHGPHVDRRNDPEKAKVSVKLTIPSLKKQVTVERNLKSPNSPTITPTSPEILAVLAKVAIHHEVVLSRRELIRYVLATPGDRAKEVQALLQLDEIGRVRSHLQKIANDCKKELAAADEAVQQAQESLVRALQTAVLSKDAVLAAANTRRAVLGLSPITSLTETTSLKDGLATEAAGKPHRIPKLQALADLKALGESIKVLEGDSTRTVANELESQLGALTNDPVIASSMTYESFYSTGLSLIRKQSCPLCDSAWDINELKGLLQRKLNQLQVMSKKRRDAETRLAPIIATLRRTQAGLATLTTYATLAQVPVTGISEYMKSCDGVIKHLSAFLPLSETVKVLPLVTKIPTAVSDCLKKVGKAVSDIPEPTGQDSAREWLVLGQERLEVWRETMRKQRVARQRTDRAKTIAEIYASTSDSVLTGIYSSVEKDFAALYGFINRSDEQGFQAKLVPSIGKLGFDVDFYGKGFFPPGAYHSEGHQDAMGLCLYLALMRHLLGSEFTVAILDDVLMSVDSGHRREVCELLKKEFPNTQFIMTTHDAIWLRHMRTEQLTTEGSWIQFRSWTVDFGPAQSTDEDVWVEIDNYLKKNDVRAAAGLLRYHLEYVSGELCHKLRAKVEYRGDAQYQLGELLPSACSALRKLLGDAKGAANSWEYADVVTQLIAKEADFALSHKESQMEQWQVNAVIHYNNWQNLSAGEFARVTSAFRNLIEHFACGDCRTLVRVSPERVSAERVVCECGKVSMNLLRK